MKKYVLILGTFLLGACSLTTARIKIPLLATFESGVEIESLKTELSEIRMRRPDVERMALGLSFGPSPQKSKDLRVAIAALSHAASGLLEIGQAVVVDAATGSRITYVLREVKPVAGGAMLTTFYLPDGRKFFELTTSMAAAAP